MELLQELYRLCVYNAKNHPFSCFSVPILQFTLLRGW